MPGLTARSAAFTVAAQLAARGISLGFVVVSSAIVARTLGVVTYADWATVLTLVTLFTFLLDPGITPVIVRRIAQDHESAPTPRAMQVARLSLGALAFAFVLVISGVLRGFDALLLAAALAFQLLPRALVLNAQPWLQSDHRLHRQTALEAVTSALGLAGLLVAAVLDAAPWVLAVFAFAVPALVLSVLIRRELARTPSASLPSPGPQRPKVRAVLAEVAPLALALALVAFYMRAFTIFLNAAESDETVGHFLFAYQFVEQVVVLAGIVAGALLPMIAQRASDMTIFTLPFTRTLTLGVFALGALGSAGLIMLAPLLTRLLGGDEFRAAAPYLELLAPMSAVILPAFLLAYLYLAIGLGRRYLWFNLAALVVNLAGNAGLTLTIGAAAAARVAWATEVVVVLLAIVPLARASGGLGTAWRGVAMIASAVVAGELAYAGVVPSGVAGFLPAVVALALGGGALLTFVSEIRAGRPGPS